MTEIRSFRAVFDLERRIYRIDRLRLNPGGIPLRGVVYFLASLAFVLLMGHVPVLDVPIRALPWYLSDLLAPAALAALCTLIAVEGRPFHLAALALLRYALGPHELSGLRPRRHGEDVLLPGEMVLLADGSDSRLRRLRYTGPGTARIACRGQVVELARGGRLEVRAPR